MQPSLRGHEMSAMEYLPSCLCLGLEAVKPTCDGRVGELKLVRAALPRVTVCPSVSLASQMSHSAVNALCRAIKLQCELYSSRQIAICLDPYCGLGFALWCLCR